MLWNKKTDKEDKIRNEQYNYIIGSVQKLRDGDKSYIHIVYSAFAFGDKDLTRVAGSAIRMHLEDYSMNQMIKLSESFRQYTSLEWSIEWRNVCLKDIISSFEQEKDYIYSLILGSFHPNGYFRESCIIELSKYQDTLAYIVLRLNDWVDSVRKCAYDLFFMKLEKCSINELFQATLPMNKVKSSERRNIGDLMKIYDAITKRIEDEMQSIPLNSICYYDFDIRKNIYKLLFSKKVFEKEKADYLLERERHSFCKSLIISGILEFYSCSMEQINIYLRNENSNVRRKALEYKYSLLENSWDGLEEMLLDKNSGIRELVIFILKRAANMNVLNYYIDHLTDIKPAIAIIGIGENGSKEHVELLLPFLNHNDEKTIRITIVTLGKLMGAEGYDLYWKYLLDIRSGISKAAYLSIRKSLIHYGAEKLFCEYKSNETHHIKRYLALLIMQENSWQRLPYLLYLYDDEDLAELRDKIRLKIINRDMYGKIDGKQIDFINKVIGERKDIFPTKLIEDIRFDIKCLMR
jgi:hypothetical protein